MVSQSQMMGLYSPSVWGKDSDYKAVLCPQMDELQVGI